MTTTQPTGSTFAVDAVTPATEPLPECRAHQAVRQALGGDIESCSDYHGTVVRNVQYHPLLAAVHTAFSQHRSLVLSPDAVWLTIAQGVAHHMAAHGERLRSRFVTHAGRLDLEFRCVGWVEGSPENPWAEAFAGWADLIRGHVGADTHDALVCDFGTTGPVERAASRVVLMDVFERYFHYRAVCICGIPAVTLEGTPADWDRLTEKAAALDRFDLGWWLDHLLPVCQQFARASRSDVDMTHWQAICKVRSEYGGDVINGWVAKLFPYLRAYIDGPCTRRNPIFETGEGFQSFHAPSGLSRVPFTWRNGATGRTRPMEAVAGLVGVEQDRDTLALRPKVGWAVRPAERLDVVLNRLREKHATFPSAGVALPEGMPEDVCRFYHHTDGAELFGTDGTAPCRVVGAADVTTLAWGEVAEHLRNNDYPNGHLWYRLAVLADGSWLAINPNPDYPEPVRQRFRDDPGNREWRDFAAVCHCRPETQGVPGRNPVVALSFTELLERLLDGGPAPYWLAPGFTAHGDAEEYTRRG